MSSWERNPPRAGRWKDTAFDVGRNENFLPSEGMNLSPVQTRSFNHSLATGQHDLIGKFPLRVLVFLIIVGFFTIDYRKKNPKKLPEF